MAFRVSLSARARRDLDTILERLQTQGAGDAGLRWWVGLQEAVFSVEKSPGRCGVAPENEQFPREIRHLLYGNRPHVYRILFTIQDDLVTVLHIRHGRRVPLTRQ